MQGSFGALGGVLGVPDAAGACKGLLVRGICTGTGGGVFPAAFSQTLAQAQERGSTAGLLSVHRSIRSAQGLLHGRGRICTSTVALGRVCTAHCHRTDGHRDSDSHSCTFAQGKGNSSTVSDICVRSEPLAQAA